MSELELVWSIFARAKIDFNEAEEVVPTFHLRNPETGMPYSEVATLLSVHASNGCHAQLTFAQSGQLVEVMAYPDEGWELLEPPEHRPSREPEAKAACVKVQFLFFASSRAKDPEFERDADLPAVPSTGDMIEHAGRFWEVRQVFWQLQTVAQITVHVELVEDPSG